MQRVIQGVIKSRKIDCLHVHARDASVGIVNLSMQLGTFGSTRCCISAARWIYTILPHKCILGELKYLGNNLRFSDGNFV